LLSDILRVPTVDILEMSEDRGDFNQIISILGSLIFCISGDQDSEVEGLGVESVYRS
jgi:hypothetical protein